MKKNVIQITIFSVVSFSSCCVYAKNIIYGFENAQHFHHQIKNPVYIQAGSFSKKTNADKYLNFLKKKTNKHVLIKSKGKLYTVLIGPISSLNEVNQTATKLLHTQPSAVQKPHHTTVISKTIINTPIEHQEATHHWADFAQNAKWFIAVGGGEQYAISSRNIFVNNGSNLPAPYNQDTYTTNTDNSAVFSLAAGKRWVNDSKWISASSLSLNWQHYFNIQPGHNILQYSDPEFLNYTYNWNFDSNLLLANAKLDLLRYQRFAPYITGGIGAAFNYAHGYNETALSGVTPRLSPGFQNHTTTQFAYQLGTGVDLQLNPKLILSVGYNYQNLGGVFSGSGVGSWSGQKLHAGSYGSNEVLATINYLFGIEEQGK